MPGNKGQGSAMTPSDASRIQSGQVCLSTTIDTLRPQGGVSHTRPRHAAAAICRPVASPREPNPPALGMRTPGTRPMVTRPTAARAVVMARTLLPVKERSSLPA